MASIGTSGNINRGNAQDDVGTYTASFGIALGIASVFNALLVLVKETNPAVMAAMNSAGNHWVTQSILDVAVFVVLGFALKTLAEKWRYQPNLVIIVAIGGVVLGGLIIAGFNLLNA